MARKLQAKGISSVDKYKQPLLLHYQERRSRLWEEEASKKNAEEAASTQVERERRAPLTLRQKAFITALKRNEVEQVQTFIHQGVDTNDFDPEATPDSPDHHPLRAALYSLNGTFVDLILSRANEATLKLMAEIRRAGKFAHLLEFFQVNPTYDEFYQRYTAQDGGDLFLVNGSCRLAGWQSVDSNSVREILMEMFNEVADVVARGTMDTWCHMKVINRESLLSITEQAARQVGTLRCKLEAKSTMIIKQKKGGASAR